MRPLFRYIARTGLREMFTSTALGLVVGIALLMRLVGLSEALGTFLAGVVLADSEYRHQLEADIEPFKGLLLGLFFISVVAVKDFNYVVHHPSATLALVAGLLAKRWLSSGAPTPDLAIQEAKNTRQSLQSQKIERDQLDRSLERPKETT